MGKVPSRGSDQFIVRFPDGMRDRIAEAAKAGGRSMNSEIVLRLEKSLNADLDGAIVVNAAGLQSIVEDILSRMAITKALARPGTKTEE